MGKRECRVCHKIKDLKMFYKNKASRLGRIRMCKKCCSISKRINGQRYRDTEQFGGNRERAIKKDKYKCVYCSMTRYQHKERFGKDITVHHKDGNGRRKKYKNNSMSNLQTLCSSCHGKKEGGKVRSWRFGERHPNSRLTEKDVIEIRKLYAPKKYTQKRLAKKFHVSRRAITHVLRRPTWNHI